MIIFLDQAEGTEEIPSEHIQAVILQHDLPQLSHLAIRARQTKIMFICCSNIDTYNNLKSQNPHESTKEITNNQGYIELHDTILQDHASSPHSSPLLSTGDADFEQSSFTTKLNVLIANNESLAQMMLKANTVNDKDDIGSKAFNSLKLQ